MYRYVLILSLLIPVAGCQSAKPGDPATSAPTASSDPMPGASATLVVNGMACPMCKTNIDRQLMKVSGVDKVKVDLGNGEVSVGFRPDLHPTRQQLVAAVEQSGFTLREIRQP
jgi:copper chaperone CopZ